MIDTLRKQLQERLDQLLAEAEKLRKALSALDPRGQQSPARRAQPRASSTAARTRARPSGSSRRRTPPGATKARVLDVLSDGNAMTAGEIAAATGLAQGTVSTTLSRLAKSGEVRKAQRGYALPEARTAGATTEGLLSLQGQAASLIFAQENGRVGGGLGQRPDSVIDLARARPDGARTRADPSVCGGASPARI